MCRVPFDSFPRRVVWWLVLCIGVVLAGCSHRETAGTAEAVTTYTVNGIIRELKPDGTNVVIKHEAIPGYMESMTMNFDATNAAVLRGLSANDAVRFQFHVAAEDSWVDHFQVLSNVGPAVVSPVEVVLNDPTAVSFFRDVPVLREGDLLTDYTLTNQLGQVIRLADYRGKVLAFNFIFTRCPMPDFCPRVTARFHSAQNTLKERRNAPPDWRLLSITMDPNYDTPRVLSKFASRYEADPAYWTFATGSYQEIQPLSSHFEVEFALNVTPDRLSHKLRTVVLDRAGRVRRIFRGNEWSAAELVEAILDAAKAQ